MHEREGKRAGRACTGQTCSAGVHAWNRGSPIRIGIRKLPSTSEKSGNCRLSITALEKQVGVYTAYYALTGVIELHRLLRKVINVIQLRKRNSIT